MTVTRPLPGAPVPASALETLVLPGRVPGYSPALLDELTSAGEIVWSGAGALPGGDGWLVLAPADGASLLLPEPAEVSMTPLHSAVLEALGGGGALFFRMLSDRVGGLLEATGDLAGALAEQRMFQELMRALAAEHPDITRHRRDLAISHEITNVNGGAIAMGHPLGATGAMILGTLVDELQRRDLRRGLATLCVGGGMGIATIVELV